MLMLLSIKYIITQKAKTFWHIKDSEVEAFMQEYFIIHNVSIMSIIYRTTR